MKLRTLKRTFKSGFYDGYLNRNVWATPVPLYRPLHYIAYMNGWFEGKYQKLDNVRFK